MKCPFRKITVHTDGRDEEMFADCYKKDCPYYKDFYGNEERCLRAKEKQDEIRT